jgi:hypothetical protein
MEYSAIRSGLAGITVTTTTKEKTMPTKTTGQKTSRINVKKLKGNPKGNAKELTPKEQKKVKGGGLASRYEMRPDGVRLTNHNETLAHDILR